MLPPDRLLLIRWLVHGRLRSMDAICIGARSTYSDQGRQQLQPMMPQGHVRGQMMRHRGQFRRRAGDSPPPRTQPRRRCHAAETSWRRPGISIAQLREAAGIAIHCGEHIAHHAQIGDCGADAHATFLPRPAMNGVEPCARFVAQALAQGVELAHAALGAGQHTQARPSARSGRAAPTTLWSPCLIRKQREVSGRVRISSNSCCGKAEAVDIVGRLRLGIGQEDLRRATVR